MFYTCENVWQSHRHLTSAILRVPQQRDAAHPTSLISRLNYADTTRSSESIGNSF
jgi:hypothetical protein